MGWLFTDISVSVPVWLLLLVVLIVGYWMGRRDRPTVAEELERRPRPVDPTPLHKDH